MQKKKQLYSVSFNFKKLFDFTSFFQDPVRNAAKPSENFGVLF
jgi:hypothetical protein